ncbi:MAG: nucleotidyltransferase family protein [Oscillospiraceae bacterium]|nr:nucleotidyltransferase family protein [Oscillospiraceae bacterium]
MRAAGIICEYDPFHRGHRYQIERVRHLLGQDTAVVCAMSGNFVQRGGPAVMNKFARAAAAAAEGADLVLELPTAVSLSSAEGFAYGAVALLAAAGVCRYLCFGTETEDLNALAGLAEILCSGAADESIRAMMKTGVSYAEARQEALRRLAGESAGCLSFPNNILGVEYLKAIFRQKAPLEPVPILRSGGSHGGEGWSGKTVRAALLTGGGWKDLVPDSARTVVEAELEAGRAPVSWRSLEQAALYRLRTMSRFEYAGLPDATEGLGDRLWKAVRRAETLDGVLELAKTRRYAMSRLRRMVTCAWLGIRAGEGREPLYLRVLAAGERGRALLAEMRTAAALPVLVRSDEARKLPEDARRAFEREAGYTDLYVLGYPEPGQRSCGSDWTARPVRSGGSDLREKEG